MTLQIYKQFLNQQNKLKKMTATSQNKIGLYRSTTPRQLNDTANIQNIFLTNKQKLQKNDKAEPRQKKLF